MAPIRNEGGETKIENCDQGYSLGKRYSVELELAIDRNMSCMITVNHDSEMEKVGKS